jgi:hypothetical protein
MGFQVEPHIAQVPLEEIGAGAPLTPTCVPLQFEFGDAKTVAEHVTPVGAPHEQLFVQMRPSVPEV